eukprot:361442-Chlamydomonas_euryale.AAC.2
MECVRQPCRSASTMVLPPTNAFNKHMYVYVQYAWWSGTPRSGTPRSGTPRSGTPRSGTPKP